MEICYLLAFPDSAENTRQPAEQIKGLKDAPYFQPIDIDLVTLGAETIVIEGFAIAVTRQRYDAVIQMVECHYDLGGYAFHFHNEMKKCSSFMNILNWSRFGGTFCRVSVNMLQNRNSLD